MVRQVSSTVRASALRSKVFILANACSIGLRVWRVGGQEKELGFGGADRGANGAALMAAEVVHNDNVARREDGRENLLDIGAEAHAIDRSVDDAGRGEPVATQRRQEREGPPSAEGCLGDEALAFGASAMGARHVGFRPGLVDEQEPPRIDRRLTRLPPLTQPGDVRPVLFGGAQAFF
jgi:hypothetical protein